MSLPLIRAPGSLHSSQVTHFCDFARSLGKRLGASDEVYDLLGIGCFVGGTLVIVDLPELESATVDAGWRVDAASAAALGCGVLFAGALGPRLTQRRRRRRMGVKQSARDFFFGRMGMDGESDLPLPEDTTQADDLEALCDRLFAAEEPLDFSDEALAEQPATMSGGRPIAAAVATAPLSATTNRQKLARRAQASPTPEPSASSTLFSRLWLLSCLLLAAALFGVAAWGGVEWRRGGAKPAVDAEVHRVKRSVAP